MRNNPHKPIKFLVNTPTAEEQTKLSNNNLVTSKSIIRYPGSKVFLRERIVERFLLAGFKNIVSPFLGGGSVELECGTVGIRVQGSDAFKPLIEFWNVLLNQNKELSKKITQILNDMSYPINETLKSPREQLDSSIIKKLENAAFYSITKKNKIERAAWFYIRNKICHMGKMYAQGENDKLLTLATTGPVFTDNMLKTVKLFNSPFLKVKQADYKHILQELPPDTPLYLDPPYYGKEKWRLYGIEGSLCKYFNHEELFDLIKDRKNWILSHSNEQYIKDLYQDFKIIELPYYPNKKEPIELLIYGSTK